MDITPEIVDQLKSLLAKNRKIEAVKLVREYTRWGLKESKDYVDSLAVSLKTGGQAQPLATKSSANRNLLLIEGRLQALLRENKKVEAIKLVREHTNWGLKEAKDYVDRLI